MLRWTVFQPIENFTIQNVVKEFNLTNPQRTSIRAVQNSAASRLIVNFTTRNVAQGVCHANQLLILIQAVPNSKASRRTRMIMSVLSLKESSHSNPLLSLILLVPRYCFSKSFPCFESLMMSSSQDGRNHNIPS